MKAYSREIRSTFYYHPDVTMGELRQGFLRCSLEQAGGDENDEYYLEDKSRLEAGESPLKLLEEVMDTCDGGCYELGWKILDEDPKNVPGMAGSQENDLPWLLQRTVDPANLCQPSYWGSEEFYKDIEKALNMSHVRVMCDRWDDTVKEIAERFGWV